MVGADNGLRVLNWEQCHLIQVTQFVWLPGIGNIGIASDGGKMWLLMIGDEAF